MTLSSRVTMPGQVRSVAAPDPSGPLYVTSYGASPLETVVTVADLSGSVAWQRTFAGTGRPRSRLSADGTLFCFNSFTPRRIHNTADSQHDGNLASNSDNARSTNSVLENEDVDDVDAGQRG
ncbi:hypothetical protein [Streptomyces sp. NPDC056672]|uniref:hypothetical protein n=1 Tax=Streptomyces sp. NPDC056672 TaxID=3345906 RepID=UPI0036AAC3D5